jgi:hypothetical protein
MCGFKYLMPLATVHAVGILEGSDFIRLLNLFLKIFMKQFLAYLTS